MLSGWPLCSGMVYQTAGEREYAKQKLESNLQAAVCAYLEDYELSHELLSDLQKILKLESRQRKLEARRIEVIYNEMFKVSEGEVVGEH
ncbi:MAG: hypothetical protein ACPGC4_06540 [Litorivicinaceae bacterium]